MNKIPVYYHIPKCGGTYLVNLYQHLNKENEKKLRKSSNNWNNKVCRNIEVFISNDKYIQISAIVELKDQIGLKSKPETIYHNFLSIKKLYELIDNKKIKITSIFIQPTGDGNMSESRKEVDKLLSYINKKPVYFTVIRCVFQRLYSEYSYLSDTMSQHEPSFNSYEKYGNFEKFLIECNTYSNSISRQIAYDLPLDKSFNQVKSFFDDFTIANMQNIKETAIKVWQECYGWSANCDNENLFYRNKNIGKKKLLIEDISQEAKEQFLLKTKWDRKLYAYLSQK